MTTPGCLFYYPQARLYSYRFQVTFLHRKLRRYAGPPEAEPPNRSRKDPALDNKKNTITKQSFTQYTTSKNYTIICKKKLPPCESSFAQATASCLSSAAIQLLFSCYSDTAYFLLSFFLVTTAAIAPAATIITTTIAPIGVVSPVFTGAVTVGVLFASIFGFISAELNTIT